MEQMNSVYIEKYKEYVRISLRGDLIYTTVSAVKKELNGSIPESKGYLLNLDGVNRIDSTGFGVIINLAKNLQKNNATMVIMVNNELIMELMEISQIHLFFPIVKNETQAIQIIREGAHTALPLQDY